MNDLVPVNEFIPKNFNMENIEELILEVPFQRLWALGHKYPQYRNISNGDFLKLFPRGISITMVDNLYEMVRIFTFKKTVPPNVDTITILGLPI